MTTREKMRRMKEGRGRGVTPQLEAAAGHRPTNAKEQREERRGEERRGEMTKATKRCGGRGERVDLEEDHDLEHIW